MRHPSSEICQSAVCSSEDSGVHRLPALQTSMLCCVLLTWRRRSSPVACVSLAVVFEALQLVLRPQAMPRLELLPWVVAANHEVHHHQNASMKALLDTTSGQHFSLQVSYKHQVNLALFENKQSSPFAVFIDVVCKSKGKVAWQAARASAAEKKEQEGAGGWQAGMNGSSSRKRHQLKSRAGPADQSMCRS